MSLHVVGNQFIDSAVPASVPACICLVANWLVGYIWFWFYLYKIYLLLIEFFFLSIIYIYIWSIWLMKLELK